MRALLFLLLFHSSFAFAGVEQISEKEFRDLAQDLSAKVNLFQEGWRKDPQAEFYGGTTRDYLYWLKGQFIEAHTKTEAATVVAKLKAQPIIDVRDFIIGDSDVDVISSSKESLDAKQFGVRKIDFQSPDILNPETEIGKNEFLQGYIPAEKIRLAKDGFHATTLGDGIGEIYRGKLSVNFASAEDFAKSKYAQEGINHPILLALRYIRLQAINYYRSYGKDFPDAVKLHAGLDEASAKKAREVIHAAFESGELKPYLEKNRFQSWLNGAIQKSFRSYTNPTAALQLMKEFGVEQLVSRYPEKIEPLNQYVFAKYRDEAAIQRALKEHQVKKKEFYQKPEDFFPDGNLYHGTKEEKNFRGILFQGILPSEGGSAGKGLYGVAEKDKSFSEKWAGDKNRLLKFPLKPGVKIVDTTQGEGLKVWNQAHLDYEDFAEKFGVDILRYPYDTQAFVVKNASVLGRAEGVYRKILTINDLIEKAKSITTPQELLGLLSVNSATQAEEELIWKNSPVTNQQVAGFLHINIGHPATEHILKMPLFEDQPKIQAELKYILSSDNPHAAYNAITQRKNRSPGFLQFVDSLFIDIDSRAYQHQIPFLRVVTGTELPTPQATAYVLAKMEENKFLTTDVGEFIRLGKFSPADLERISALYLASAFSQSAGSHLPGNKAIIDILYNDMASTLLRHNHNMEGVKEKLAENLLENRNINQYWGKLKLLVQYFPNDPVTSANAAGFTRLFAQHGISPEQLKPLSVYPEVREEIIKQISSVYKNEDKTAIELVSHLTLPEEDWVKVLDGINKVKPDMVASIKRILAALPSSDEITKALMRCYVRSPLWAPGLRSPLVEAIKSNSSSTVEYALEMLANVKTYGRPGKIFKPFEGAQILQLVNFEAIPLTPEIKEAGLAFLEKYATKETAESNSLLEHNFLTLINHDEHTQNRIRTLLQENRLNSSCQQAFTALGASP